jgi:two-component system, LytTR family, response regulator
MHSCLIVDDEQNAIDILLQHVKHTPSLRVVASLTNPVEALRLINTGKIEVAFIDMHMPMLSGADIVKTVQSGTKIILTTADTQFASEAFDWGVADYLLKPIALPRFIKAVNRATQPLSSAADSLTTAAVKNKLVKTNHIFIKGQSKSKRIKILLSDIDFIEGMKNYVGIHYKGKLSKALLNMKDLEVLLPAKSFIRIHKSFIVAIDKIVEFDSHQLSLQKINRTFGVGNAYKAALQRVVENSFIK